MLIRQTPDIRPSEITDESVYLNRRQFLRLSGIGAGVLLGAGACGAADPVAQAGDGESRSPVSADGLSTSEKSNTWEEITTYNNYYEFGTDKSDPHMNAADFVTQPWSITVGGECAKPGAWPLEKILGIQAAEERIYRLRCVEAWSMVIPWRGLPLARILAAFEPISRARFVRFETLFDPKQMRGQRYPVLDWPYVEALTIEEAMNPLSFIATGLYGRELPNQNGAPLRLVLPWKYGFKSIKSIVRIDFTEDQPKNSWAISAPNEYGFYANVNPEVDHPRWSQARERRIGKGLFAARQETLMFNGYAEQVAHLYAGLDLRKHF